jgi:hypothetical protein
MCDRSLKVLYTPKTYMYIGNQDRITFYQKPHGLRCQKPRLFAMRFLVSLKSFIYSITYCYYGHLSMEKTNLGSGFLGF